MSAVSQGARLGGGTGVLLTTSLVSALIMLDSNIVAVSLPAIGQSLHANFSSLEWVISAYLLSYAALLLAAGSYADLYGRKRAMIIGLVIFAAASAACGLSVSTLMLNVSRAVQAIGGAMLLTAALAIISASFEGDARTHAFAVWGAALGVALTAGPIVGGAITNWFGWRWVFLVNIPACIALVVMAWSTIEESRDPHAHRMDFKGVMTFTPGLFLLIWALIDGNRNGWLSTSIVARILFAIMFLIAFVAVELKHERPMLDFRLLRLPHLLGAVIAMIGYGAAAQVMVFYLPLYLQNAYGFAPGTAGLAMLPFALPMVLVPRLTTRMARNRSARTMLVVGLIVSCVGNLMFWWLAGTHVAYGGFLVAMLVAGSGAGVLNGETVKAIGAAVPKERAGMASGLASTTRFIGILFGVAGIGAVLANVATSTFFRAAESLGIDAATARSLAAAVASGDIHEMSGLVPAAVLPRVEQSAHAAFASGFATACVLAAIVGAIAAALTFRQLGRRSGSSVVGASAVQHGPCMVVDCRNPI